MSFVNRFPFAKRSFQELVRDERGVSAIFITLLLSSMIGMAGLGVESGLWFTERRSQQTATDAAAIAGAWQMAAQETAGTTVALNTSSTGPAQKEGVRNGAPAGTITITQLAGPAAQAVIAEPHSSLLTGAFLPGGSVTINTIAVASLTSTQTCALSLATGKTGIAVDAINLAGKVSLTMSNCMVAANSSSSAAIHLQGSATLSAANVTTEGSISYTGSAASLGPGTVPYTGAPAVTDPYASSAAAFAADLATVAGMACASSAGATLSPGRYCGGLDATGKTLNPGTYYIDGNSSGGDFVVKGGTTTGTGVTIVLTSTTAPKDIGAFNIGSNGIVTLSAPTAAGTYQGIVVYQDPSVAANTTATSFASNSTATLTGAIYAPNGQVDFQGGPSAAAGSSCLEIIALTMQFQGNPSLDETNCSALGVKTPKIYSVTLSL